jgi:hypothetical protein
VIDRTFCALRVWAATQPEAMKDWIDTLEDPEMRKALLWLRKNPWGGPKETGRSEGGADSAGE